MAYFYFGGLGFVILVCIIICIIRARRNAQLAAITKPQTVVITAAAPDPVPMQPYPPIHNTGNPYGAPAPAPAQGYPYYQQPHQPYPVMPQSPPPQAPYPSADGTYPQTPYQQAASVYPAMPTPMVQPAPMPSPAPVSTMPTPSEGVFSPPPAYTAAPSLQPAPPVPFGQNPDDAKKTIGHPGIATTAGYDGNPASTHYGQGSESSRRPQAPQTFN